MIFGGFQGFSVSLAGQNLSLVDYQSFEIHFLKKGMVYLKSLKS